MFPAASEHTVFQRIIFHITEIFHIGVRIIMHLDTIYTGFQRQVFYLKILLISTQFHCHAFRRIFVNGIFPKQSHDSQKDQDAFYDQHPPKCLAFSYL